MWAYEDAQRFTGQEERDGNCKKSLAYPMPLPNGTHSTSCMCISKRVQGSVVLFPRLERSGLSRGQTSGSVWQRFPLVVMTGRCCWHLGGRRGRSAPHPTVHRTPAPHGEFPAVTQACWRRPCPGPRRCLLEARPRPAPDCLLPAESKVKSWHLRAPFPSLFKKICFY